MPFDEADSPDGAFNSLKTPEEVMAFFRRQFLDAIPLLPNQVVPPKFIIPIKSV